MQLFNPLIASVLLFVFSAQADTGSGVTHSELKEVIGAFLTAMEPWMQENRNATLSVKDQWRSEDATGGGAGAHGIGGWSHIEVHLTGAFSKNPLNTPDMTAFALCHELGHLAAVNGSRVNELPADLFAITECLPRVFQEYPSKRNLDLGVETRMCSKNKNQPMCARILRAALNAAQFRFDYREKGFSSNTDTQPSYTITVKNPNDISQCALNVAVAKLTKNSMAACWTTER